MEVVNDCHGLHLLNSTKKIASFYRGMQLRMKLRAHMKLRVIPPTKKLSPGEIRQYSRNKPQGIKNKTETPAHFQQRIYCRVNHKNRYAGRRQMPLCFHFLTLEDIPVQEERNTKVLMLSRFAHVC
jgi:hypothetical protein